MPKSISLLLIFTSENKSEVSTMVEDIKNVIIKLRNGHVVSPREAQVLRVAGSASSTGKIALPATCPVKQIMFVRTCVLAGSRTVASRLFVFNIY